MKKVILISVLVMSFLFSRQVLIDTNDALSIKVSNNITNIDNQNIDQNSVRSSREEIVIFEWDFETDLWNNDEGWLWTDTDYHSETHSYLSPNTEDTYNNSWNVISNTVTLPELGEGEIEI